MILTVMVVLCGNFSFKMISGSVLAAVFPRVPLMTYGVPKKRMIRNIKFMSDRNVIVRIGEKNAGIRAMGQEKLLRNCPCISKIKNKAISVIEKN